MEQPKNGAYFRSLKIIHIAICAGQVMFLAIALLLVYGLGMRLEPALASIFMYIVPIGAVAGFGMSQLLYKSLVRKASSQQTLNEKVNNYRAAFLVRLALLEAPSFLATIAFLLTGVILFAGIAVVIAVWCLLQRPVAEQIGQVLQLSYQELEALGI